MDSLKSSSSRFGLPAFSLLAMAVAGQSLQLHAQEATFATPETVKRHSYFREEFKRALQVDSLIKSWYEGDSKATYQLANDMRWDFEGSRQFDRIFGVASYLQADYDEAAFALRREFKRAPYDYGMRLKLAEAAYYIGQKGEAHSHFKAIVAQQAPADISDRANIFITAIETERPPVFPGGTPNDIPVTAQSEDATQDEIPERGLYGYGKFGLGYDTNRNGAAFTPAGFSSFIDENLTDDLERNEGGYSQFEGELGYEYPFTKRHSVLLEGRVFDREFFSGDFNSVTLGVQAGWVYRGDNDGVKAALTYEQLQWDSNDLRDQLYLSGEWVHRYSYNTVLFLLGQAGQLSYDSQSLRDSSLYTLAGGVRYRFEGKQEPKLTVALLSGDESPDTGSALAKAYADRTMWAINSQYGFNIAENLSLSLQLRYQTNEYDGVNPVYSVKRKDNIIRGGFEFVWQFLPNWAGIVDADWTVNSTSFPEDYQRERMAFSIRYQPQKEE